jgi:hypothetical protein
VIQMSVRRALMRAHSQAVPPRSIEANAQTTQAAGVPDHPRPMLKNVKGPYNRSMACGAEPPDECEYSRKLKSRFPSREFEKRLGRCRFRLSTRLGLR